MNQEKKSSILQLISNGKIQKAIDEFVILDISELQKKEAVAISSQFQELQNKSRQGILSSEQENLQRNQIVNRFIDCINTEDKRPTFPTLNENNPIWEKRIVLLIGLLISAASILGLWWTLKNNCSNTPLQLTVFVKDKNGNVALEYKGELHTSIGHQTFHAIIGEDGRTNFDEIPIRHKGHPITIGLKAEGWEIENGNNEFVFTGEPITLKVKRDNSLGIIKGVVKSRDGQDFIDGAMVLINSDTSIVTNDLGVFKIILSNAMQVKKASDSYLLTVSKEGYKTKTQYYYPKSSDAEIRLENK